MSVSRFPFTAGEWLARLPGRCPATWVIIGANAATFLVSFVVGTAVWANLTFSTGSVLPRPWTAFTYPLIGSTQILWLLLGAYVFWLFGGSLERAWGMRDYVVFLMLIAASPALALWVGDLLTGRGAVTSGLWLPLASVIVAWTVINPNERMLLYFVIPLEARWLGVIAVALLFFSFPFPLGAFALAGPGASWWFVREGRFRLAAGSSASRGRARGRSRRTMLNPLAALQRWQQKRRFMRLTGSQHRGEPDDRIH